MGNIFHAWWNRTGIWSSFSVWLSALVLKRYWEKARHGRIRTAQHRSRCAHNPDATRHLNGSARRRSLLPQDQPVSTSTPIGPQETLHHLLLECPGTLAVRQRLGIELDLCLGKFSQWQLLHSRKLLSLFDHLFGTQMASCG
ncbi:L1Tc protein [Trypanosoma cruzi]|nr:L1Tc protein [Trypanosoma cruzi]